MNVPFEWLRLLRNFSDLIGRRYSTGNGFAFHHVFHLEQNNKKKLKYSWMEMCLRCSPLTDCRHNDTKPSHVHTAHIYTSDVPKGHFPWISITRHFYSGLCCNVHYIFSIRRPFAQWSQRPVISSSQFFVRKIPFAMALHFRETYFFFCINYYK